MIGYPESQIVTDRCSNHSQLDLSNIPSPFDQINNLIFGPKFIRMINMAVTFTILTQAVFAFQAITGIIFSIYEYRLYKRDELLVQKFLLAFLASMTIGGILGTLFITTTGLTFVLVNINATLTIAILLTVAITLIGKKIYIIIPVLLFIASTSIDLLIILSDSQLFSDTTKPLSILLNIILSVLSVIIFGYFAISTKDFAIITFVLGISFFTLGGVGVNIDELIFAGGFFLANLCFIAGIVLPKMLQVQVPDTEVKPEP